MVDHLWSLHMCVYNCIIYTTTCGIMQYRGPSGYGALSLAFHPLHMDVTRNTVNCHLQKLSDDTAIVRCVSEGTDRNTWESSTILLTSVNATTRI